MFNKYCQPEIPYINKKLIRNLLVGRYINLAVGILT